MSNANLENVKTVEGGGHDVVGIEFCDPKQELYGLLRIARSTGDGAASAVAVLFAKSEVVIALSQLEAPAQVEDWNAVDLGSVRMTIEQPLESWSAAVDDGNSGFEIELKALTPPLELAGADPVGEATGTREYEQLCDVKGKARIDGKPRELHCTGRRMHIWGSPDWQALDSRRSIHLMTAEGNGVAILSGRPSAAAGHGDDAIGARLVLAGSEPIVPDELRVSTVYDAERLPSSASVELWLGEEDELAHRASGEAICRTALSGNGRDYRISFFRWFLDGRPAWGSYLITSAQRQ